MESKFVRVQFDPVHERYLDDDRRPVIFPRTVTIRFEGVEQVVRLGWTRDVMGLKTTGPVPCVRMHGEKTFMDDPSIEISAMDVVVDGNPLPEVEE